MGYNKEKARENRERKELEAEQETGLPAKNGAVVAEAVKVDVSKANQFSDEYTLEVDMDYDPAADIFRIPKKDPNYEYRWARDDSKRLSRLTTTLLQQLGGWQLVPKAHSLRIGFKDREISEDGHKRIGEHILVFMPKAVFDRKNEMKKAKIDARTGDIRRNVGEGIRVIGGKGASSRLRDKAQKDNSYETPND